MVQPVPDKMRLEMVIGMQNEILDGEEITSIANCKFKSTQNLNLNLYREIQRNSKTQFEFVPRDTEEFEILDFDWLNKISPPFRISFCISLTISSLTPSTQFDLFPILICFFLIPNEIPLRKAIKR